MILGLRLILATATICTIAANSSRNGSTVTAGTTVGAPQQTLRARSRNVLRALRGRREPARRPCVVSSPGGPHSCRSIPRSPSRWTSSSCSRRRSTRTTPPAASPLAWSAARPRRSGVSAPATAQQARARHRVEDLGADDAVAPRVWHRPDWGPMSLFAVLDDEEPLGAVPLGEVIEIDLVQPRTMPTDVDEWSGRSAAAAEPIDLSQFAELPPSPAALATRGATAARRRASSRRRGRGRTRCRRAAARRPSSRPRRSAGRTPPRRRTCCRRRPGRASRPVKRCGCPSGSSYSSAIEPGVWPAIAITSRVQSPTGDGVALGDGTGDGYAGLLGHGRGVRCADDDLGAGGGDDVGQRAVVVPVLVGGDDGGQPGVADERQQRVGRRVGRVDQHLVAGVVAPQQVAVVGHLRVDRDLGDGQVGRARGRRRLPPGCHVAGVGVSAWSPRSDLRQGAAVAGQSVAVAAAGEPPAEVRGRCR